MSDDLDKRNLKNPKNMTAAQARKVAQELRESTYQYNVKLPDGETENGETKYRTITRLKPLAGEMSPTMRSQMQNKYPNLYKPNQPSVAPMRTELQEVSKAQQIGAMSVMSRKISELQKPVKELEKQIEVNRQKGLPNLVAKQESELRRLKEQTDFQVKLLRNTQPQAETPVSGYDSLRPDSLVPQQTAPYAQSIPITQPTGVTRPYDEQVDLGQVDKPVEFQPEGIKLDNMSKEQQEFVKSMGSIDKLESVVAQAKALDIKFEDMPKIQRAFEESAYASLSMGTYQPYTKMEKQADGTSKLTQDTKALEEQTTGEVFASVLGSFAGSVPMLQIGGVVSGKMLAGTLARIGPFLPKAISKPVYDVAGKVVSYAFDSKIGQRLLSGLGFGFFWGVRPAVSGVLQKKPAGQVIKETASSFGWGFLMGTALPGMRAVTQPLVDKKFIPEALKLPLSRALAAGSVTFPLELGRGKLEQTIAKNVREKQEQGEDVSTYLVERTDSQILQDAIVETMIDMVMDGFEGIDAKNVQVAMPENLQQELQFRDDLGKLGFQEHTDVDINGQTVGTGIMLKNDLEQGILAVRLPFANAEYKNRVDYQAELGSKIAPETPPQIQPEVTPEVASTRPNELDIASVKEETPPVDNTVVPESVAQSVTETPAEGAVSVPKNDILSKIKPEDRITSYQDLKDKISTVSPDTIKKEQSEALFAVIEGVAAYKNISPDDYVRERYAGFESTNRGTKTLAQTKYLDDAKVVLKAFKNNDVVSMAHEVAHVFRRDLDAPDMKIAEDWVGVKDGKWTNANEEKFAEGFTTYLEEGKAPNAGLRGVFEKFKKWAGEIYKKIRGKKEVKLNDEIRRVFDKVVSGRKVEVAGKEVTPVTSKVTPAQGAVSVPETVATKKVIEGSRLIPVNELSQENLVRRLKAQYGSDVDYGRYAQAMNLKPDIDAKQFYKIRDSVSPNMMMRKTSVEFAPTHYDNLMKQNVQVTDTGKEGLNRYEGIWEKGMTGGLSKEMISERLVKLDDNGNVPNIPKVTVAKPSEGTVSVGKAETSRVPMEIVKPQNDYVAGDTFISGMDGEVYTVVEKVTGGRYLAKAQSEITGDIEKDRIYSQYFSKEELDDTIKNRDNYLKNVKYNEDIKARELAKQQAINKKNDLGNFLDDKSKSMQTKIKNQLTGKVERWKMPDDKIITGTKKDFIEALNPFVVKAEIKEGTGTVKINEYRLYDSDNSWYKVSKAEFDYYNYLQDKPSTPKVSIAKPTDSAIAKAEPKVTIAEKVNAEVSSPKLDKVAADYGFTNAKEAELAILAKEGTVEEFKSKLGASASEAKTYRDELIAKIDKMGDEDLITMKDEIQILYSQYGKGLSNAERKERKSLISQIVKLSKSDLRPDYAEQRDQLLDAIDIGYKGMKASKVVQLTDLQNKLLQDPDFYVSTREKAQIERLGKTPLSKMDTDDLRDMVNILKSIEHLSKTDDKLIGQARKQKISDVVENTRQNIKPNKSALSALRGLRVGTPSKIKKGRIPSVWGDETYTPSLLANTIEGAEGPINDLTFKAFDKGTTVRLGSEQKLSKMWQEAQGKQDLSKWSRQSDKPEFVKIKIPEVTISSRSGDETFIDYELALTPFERGRIWFEYNNRGEYLDDMITSGIRIKDDVLETQVIKFANGIDDVRRIAETATQTEKDIATIMAEHFKTDGRKDVDDITMALWGRHITRDNYGMPIQRSSLDYTPYTKTSLVPGSSIRILEKTGLLRERTGKNIPVLLEGLDETWNNYINEISALKGYAIPVRDLKKVIRDKGMQEVFKGAGQKKKLALLERYLQDMEGVLENPLETKSIFQRLFRNFSSAAVVGNIGTSMIQLPSLFYSMPDIGWQYMSSLKAQPNFAEMREHSPQAFDRLQGHMEADFGIDTNKSRKYTMLGWKGSTYDEVFTKYLSKSLRSPDAWVVGNLWEMIKRKVSTEQPHLQGDKFWNEVDRQWTDTVNRRQPTSYPHARSATGRTKDMFVKSYTLFTTQLNNAKAMLIEGALDISRDGNTRLGMSKIITVILGIGMLKTLRDRFMAKLKGDSPTYKKGEEPTKTKQVADFLAEMLVNTLAVDYVSNKVVGMMYRKMKYGTFGYDITDIISDSINDFATGAVQLMQAGSQYINDERYDQGNKLYGYKKDDPKWDRTFWKGVKNTTYPILHGMRIPARNIETNWEIIDRMFKEQDN